MPVFHNLTQSFLNYKTLMQMAVDEPRAAHAHTQIRTHTCSYMCAHSHTHAHTCAGGFFGCLKDRVRP